MKILGEKLFNNIEYQIIPIGSMHIPPRVDGSFNLQLKDRNGNILSVDCYI